MAKVVLHHSAEGIEVSGKTSKKTNVFWSTVPENEQFRNVRVPGVGLRAVEMKREKNTKVQTRVDVVRKSRSEPAVVGTSNRDLMDKSGKNAKNIKPSKGKDVLHRSFSGSEADMSGRDLRRASIKNLSIEDKKRVANLIKELAKTGEERELALERLQEERVSFEARLSAVQEEQASLRLEKDVLQQKLKQGEVQLKKYEMDLKRYKEVKRNQDVMLKKQSVALAQGTQTSPAHKVVTNSSTSPFQKTTAKKKGSGSIPSWDDRKVVPSSVLRDTKYPPGNPASLNVPQPPVYSNSLFDLKVTKSNEHLQTAKSNDGDGQQNLEEGSRLQDLYLREYKLQLDLQQKQLEIQRQQVLLQQQLNELHQQKGKILNNNNGQGNAHSLKQGAKQEFREDLLTADTKDRNVAGVKSNQRLSTDQHIKPPSVERKVYEGAQRSYSQDRAIYERNIGHATSQPGFVRNTDNVGPQEYHTLKDQHHHPLNNGDHISETPNHEDFEGKGGSSSHNDRNQPYKEAPHYARTHSVNPPSPSHGQQDTTIYQGKIDRNTSHHDRNQPYSAKTHPVNPASPYHSHQDDTVHQKNGDHYHKTSLEARNQPDLPYHARTRPVNPPYHNQPEQKAEQRELEANIRRYSHTDYTQQQQGYTEIPPAQDYSSGYKEQQYIPEHNEPGLQYGESKTMPHGEQRTRSAVYTKEDVNYYKDVAHDNGGHVPSVARRMHQQQYVPSHSYVQYDEPNRHPGTKSEHGRMDGRYSSRQRDGDLGNGVRQQNSPDAGSHSQHGGMDMYQNVGQYSSHQRDGDLGNDIRQQNSPDAGSHSQHGGMDMYHVNRDRDGGKDSGVRHHSRGRGSQKHSGGTDMYQDAGQYSSHQRDGNSVRQYHSPDSHSQHRGTTEYRYQHGRESGSRQRDGDLHQIDGVRYHHSSDTGSHSQHGGTAEYRYQPGRESASHQRDGDLYQIDGVRYHHPPEQQPPTSQRRQDDHQRGGVHRPPFHPPSPTERVNPRRLKFTVDDHSQPYHDQSTVNHGTTTSAYGTHLEHDRHACPDRYCRKHSERLPSSPPKSQSTLDQNNSYQRQHSQTDGDGCFERYQSQPSYHNGNTQPQQNSPPHSPQYQAERHPSYSHSDGRQPPPYEKRVSFPDEYHQLEARNNGAAYGPRLPEDTESPGSQEQSWKQIYSQERAKLDRYITDHQHSLSERSIKEPSFENEGTGKTQRKTPSKSNVKPLVSQQLVGRRDNTRHFNSSEKTGKDQGYAFYRPHVSAHRSPDVPQSPKKSARAPLTPTNQSYPDSLVEFVEGLETTKPGHNETILQTTQEGTPFLNSDEEESSVLDNVFFLRR